MSNSDYNYEADILDSALKLKAHCKIQFEHRHGCQDCCFMCFMDREMIDECPLSAMYPEQWDISDELSKLFSEPTSDSHGYLNKVAIDTKEQQVTPMPKTRYRWIQWGRDSAYNKYYRCSCCQHEIMIDDMCDSKLPSFCESCGAQMNK
jgi:hypothetical protein